MGEGEREGGVRVWGGGGIERKGGWRGRPGSVN